MKKILLILFSSLAAQSAFAVISCNSFSFLKPSYNYVAGEQCLTAVRACKKQGSLPDQNCVNKISAKNTSCKQIKKLANILQANLSSLTITPSDKFYIVKQEFIADGQQTFYILTPKACIIKTNVDARKFSQPLAHTYGTQNWLIVNSDEPKLSKEKNGLTAFTTRLRVANGCLACDTLGWVYVNFIFDHKGNLVNRTAQFKQS